MVANARIYFPMWQLVFGVMEADRDYSSNISRKISALSIKNPVLVGNVTGTFSAIVNCVGVMRHKGWIDMRPEGRLMILSLTAKGKEMRDSCITLMKSLDMDMDVAPKAAHIEDMPVSRPIQAPPEPEPSRPAEDTEYVMTGHVKQRKISARGKFPKSE